MEEIIGQVNLPNQQLTLLIKTSTSSVEGSLEETVDVLLQDMDGRQVVISSWWGQPYQGWASAKAEAQSILQRVSPEELIKLFQENLNR